MAYAGLKDAALEAKAAWETRAASKGRNEAATDITFRFEGSTYRAEFGKRFAVFEIASHGTNVRYGTRVETRRV